MPTPTHVYTVILDRTVEQRAKLSILAEDADHAIKLALDAVKRRDPEIAWRHHATASKPAAAPDLVIDHGEPDPVLPFRGPGIL